MLLNWVLFLGSLLVRLRKRVSAFWRKRGKGQGSSESRGEKANGRTGKIRVVCAYVSPIIQWSERQVLLSYFYGDSRDHLTLIPILSLGYLWEWLCLHSIKRSGSLGRCDMMNRPLVTVYSDHVNCKIVILSFNHGLCLPWKQMWGVLVGEHFSFLSSSLHVFLISPDQI